MRGKTTLATALLVATALAAGPARADELDTIQALADRGRTKEALRQLERHLAGRPNQLDGQLLRGWLLADLGRTRDAERAFLLLARQYPASPEPAHNLAVMQARAGRPAMATVALKELVDRHPTYEMAVGNLERIRQAANQGEFDPLEADGRRLELALTPRLRFAAEPPIVAAEPPIVAAEAPVTTAESPAATAQVPAVADTAPVVAGAAAGQAEPTVPAPRRPRPSAPATRALDIPLTDLRPIGQAPAPRPAPETPPEEVVPLNEAVPTPPPAMPARPAAEPAAGAAADPPKATAEPPAASPAAEAPAPDAPAEDLRSQLQTVVTAWAAAWSEQRVKEYLAFYASGFEPAGHPSRAAWEAARRQRVAAPTFIEVEIDLDSMTVVEIGPDEAAATFGQSYRSDRYADTVRKTLVFTRESGAWRIVSEVSQ